MKTIRKILTITILIAAAVASFLIFHHDGEHLHSAIGQLKLNDGKKWKADKSTLELIAQMREKAEAAYSNSSAEKQDHQKSIVFLKKQYNAIFERCTMTGDAHDQLHVYLVQLEEKMDQLDLSIAEDDQSKIKAYTHEVHLHLQNFNQHFE